MKSFTFILTKFLILALLSSSAFSLSALAQTGDIKYISGDVVNIRSGPSTDDPVVTQATRNETVSVVSELDSGWTVVDYHDQDLFIKSEYLSDSPVAVKSYSDDDLYILAHVLCGECQTYPDEEQRYVGSVVLNRVASKHFPNNIHDVVFQRGQYACTWDGNYYRTPTDRNWANARWLLENGSVLPSYVVYQSGSKLGKVYLKTRYHYYCYD